MTAFTVLGHPAPKGSAKAFVRGGRAIITNDCAAAKPWAQAVHWTAREVAPEKPWEGPIEVVISFSMPRPGRLGKKRAGVLCDRRPDVDKLVRTVLDALTGIFWIDDSQVVSIATTKLYADFGAATGARIEVSRIEEAAS